jgi:formylglycine-generating enzyme required for sulfatase activity
MKTGQVTKIAQILFMFAILFGFLSCNDEESYLSQSTTPKVTNVTPSDGATDIPVNASISVRFSQSLELNEVTTNFVDTSCYGTIQVSANGFETCSKMSATPSSNSERTIYTVKPLLYLTGYTNYKVKVHGYNYVTGVGFNTGEDIMSASIPEIEGGMLLLPSGTFNMGSNLSSAEQPIHSVSVSSFYMSDHKATAAEYKLCVDSGSCYYNGGTAVNYTYGAAGKENHPMTYVSWHDAQTFILWLNQNSAMSFRLCSEAEWEYAARAGTTTTYWCGDNFSCLDSNEWTHLNNDATTHIVKSKSANPWGLYDVSGNGFEFVQDFYHNTYSGAPTDGSAWESPDSNQRMVRSFSTLYSTQDSSYATSYRNYYAPASRYEGLSFRLCADP